MTSVLVSWHILQRRFPLHTTWSPVVDLLDLCFMDDQIPSYHSLHSFNPPEVLQELGSCATQGCLQRHHRLLEFFYPLHQDHHLPYVNSKERFQLFGLKITSWVMTQIIIAKEAVPSPSPFRACTRGIWSCPSWSTSHECWPHPQEENGTSPTWRWYTSWLPPNPCHSHHNLTWWHEPPRKCWTKPCWLCQETRTPVIFFSYFSYLWTLPSPYPSLCFSFVYSPIDSTPLSLMCLLWPVP